MTRQNGNEEEVAQWIHRLEQPTVDTQAGKAFDQWMREDSRHRDDFADMQALWQSDTLIKVLRDASDEDAQGDVRAITPAATHAMLRDVRVWSAAAACAALTLILLVPMLLTNSYRTGPGNGTQIILADGSRVDLSGNAVLDVRMLPWRRDATLTQGEAFFDVRHDPGRPFQVRSGSTSVRVLGTAFNVDRQDADRVVVDVYRGTVAVEAGNSAARLLHRGDSSRVVDGGVTTVPAARAVQTRLKPDWTAGWFEANDVPLSVVMAKVQRHSAQPIRLQDDAIRNMPVSGRFRIAEPDRVLDAMRDVYRLDVRSEKGVILIGHWPA